MVEGFGGTYGLIVLLATVTYALRIGGDLVLSRFKRLHPRVEAGLEAVPAAVLITLVIPPALTGSPAEAAAIAVAVIASLRLPPVSVLVLGMAVLIAGRAAGF